MKTIVTLAMLFAISAIARSQVSPAATAGAADLRYSVHYSEAAASGGTIGSWHTISPSVSLTYSSGRKRFPFNLELAGGYSATLSGSPYMSGAFQHALIAQGFTHRKWDFRVMEDVAYRPQSPTTGFSGIAGTGEPIGPGGTPPSSQPILTLKTHALESATDGSLQHTFNHRLVLNAESSYDLLHYPDGNGLDTNSLGEHAGLSIRLNSRNWLTTQYAHSQFTYSGYDLQVTTSGFRFGLSRSMTRSLHLDAAVGPEWVSISRGILPTPIQLSAQAGVDYQYRRMSAALSYAREISGGSGYMIGSESNNLSASLSRVLGRSFTIEANGGYNRSSALVRRWNISSIFGGVQTSWRIAKTISAFVNYTGTAQAAGLQASSNVQDGVIHSISYGIGFSSQTRTSR